MLNVLLRIIIIGFFGLLGFTNLLVLHDVLIDWTHHHRFGEFTGWTQRVLQEFIREYMGDHRSVYQDVMPTVLSLILIIIFYLSGNLIMTDILVAILIFDDAQIIRNHIEKRPPLTVRAAVHAKAYPNQSARDSRLFLADVATQTVVSLLFMILPYLYVLITK